MSIMKDSTNKAQLITNEGKQNVPSLWSLRLICASAIVIIHSNLIGKEYCMPLCRLAVPIFFMITGYFTFEDDVWFNTQKTKENIIKLVKIIIIINTLYLLLYFCIYLFNGFFDKDMLKISYWASVFVFGGKLVYQAWYLNAYVQALVVLLVLKNFRYGESIFYILIPIGLFLNLILGKYGFVLGLPTDLQQSFSRNVVTVGLPCLGIGMLLKKHNGIVCEIRHLGVILIISITLLYIESLFLRHIGIPEANGNIVLCTIPVSVCLFSLCLKNKNAGAGLLEDLGKKHSTNIYYVHYAFVIIFAHVVSIGSLIKYEALVIILFFFIYSIVVNRIKAIRKNKYA